MCNFLPLFSHLALQSSLWFWPPLACHWKTQKDAKMRPLMGRAPTGCTFPKSVSSGINNSLAGREGPVGLFHKPVLVTRPPLEEMGIWVTQRGRQPLPCKSHFSYSKGHVPCLPPAPARVLCSFHILRTHFSQQDFMLTSQKY